MKQKLIERLNIHSILMTSYDMIHTSNIWSYHCCSKSFCDAYILRNIVLDARQLLRSSSNGTGRGFIDETVYFWCSAFGVFGISPKHFASGRGAAHLACGYLNLWCCRRCRLPVPLWGRHVDSPVDSPVDGPLLLVDAFVS